jgi:hypothetical protein
MAAGIASVMGGVDGISLTQSVGETDGLYINGAANSSGGNLFSFEPAALAAADTIIGSGSSDTLLLANPDSLDDTFFAHLKGVSLLELSGASAVTLGGGLFPPGSPP